MDLMNQINKVNALAGEASVDTNFEYKVGMEVGLIDPMEMTQESVEWYTIAAIEADEDLPVGFLYLVSDNANKNIHSKAFNINGQLTLINYAEIIDTLSDLIVIP